MTTPVLAGREYKLLLDPRQLAKRHAPGEEANFWQDTMTGVIASSLGALTSGKPRHKGQLAEDKRRNVRFLDTKDGLLATHGFCLRLRRAADAEDKKPQITLKFRSPDFFIAGGLDIPGSKPKAETKFEEDIAPLAVQLPDTSGASFAAVASIRSRYAVSTAQKDEEPRTLADVFEQFPKLAAALKQFGGEIGNKTAPLISGLPVSERTFTGASADLGGECAAHFTLSLWNMGLSEPKPKAAEISFAVELAKGAMPDIAASRAYRLFNAMQVELSAMLETRELSKTALAIPVRLGEP